MARTYLSLGSNIAPDRHLPAALQALRSTYGDLSLSPVYRSVALGFEGADFLNLVAAFESGATPGTIQSRLREIEAASGRRRDGERFSDRSLDIDLLLWGEARGVIEGIRLPRPEILECAFVLRPLADIAPQLKHPETGLTMARHWADFDPSSQPLWRVSPDWMEAAGP